MLSLDEIKSKFSSVIQKIEASPVGNALIKSGLKEIPFLGEFLIELHKNINEENKEKVINEILELLKQLNNDNLNAYNAICELIKMDKQSLLNDKLIIKKLMMNYNKLEDLSTRLLQDNSEIKTMLKILLKSSNNFETINFKESNFSLDEYINDLKNFNRTTYGGEEKSLHEYYIRPKMVRVKQINWNLDYFETGKEIIFDFEDFFNSQDEHSAIIGASFGIGKTSLSRSTISDYAFKYKNQGSNWIPILITLKHGIDRAYNQYNLDDLLTLICKSSDKNIFILLDGLDEYNGDLRDLINKIKDQQINHPKLKKVIATSRLEANTPLDLFARHIKLLPFSKLQVNQFSKNYLKNGKHNYESLKAKGLQTNEIVSPLFCWIIAYSDLNNSSEIEFNKSWSGNLQKALLYISFIHNLLHGKFYTEVEKSEPDNWNENYKNEKNFLRKIASIKSIYKEKCTKDNLIIELKNYEDLTLYDDNNIMEQLKPILSSYFYSKRERQDNLIEFLHRSFQDYLLAEYYIECILYNKPFRLNVGVPTEATIMFLDGLLEILTIDISNQIDEQSISSIFKHTGSEMQYFNENNLEESKNILIQNAINIVNNDELFIIGACNKHEKWQSIKARKDNFENINIHKWLALFVLNKFQKLDHIPKTKLEYMIKTTSKHIPSYMKTFTNTKLTEYDFDHIDFSKANLSNSDLSKTKLEYADLNGIDCKKTIFDNALLSHVKFCGVEKSLSNLNFASFKNADLTGADLLYVNLQGADLTGANLTRADLTGANLTDAILEDANLSHAILKKVIINKTKFNSESNLTHCDFTDSKISSAQVFSNAKLLYSKFENVELSGKILEQFKNSKILDKIDLQGIICKSKLSNIIFNNTNLSEVKFQSKILEEVTFSNCKLPGARFNSKMNRVTFKDSILDGAIFTKTTMEDIDFSNLSMKNCILTHANLKQVNFLNSKLDNIDICGTNFNDVDFSGADLTGSKLSVEYHPNKIFPLRNFNVIVNNETITKNIQFKYSRYINDKPDYENIKDTDKITTSDEKFKEIIIRDNPKFKDRISIP